MLIAAYSPGYSRYETKPLLHPVHIGVLAEQGTKQCKNRWESTMKYLADVTGNTTKLLCLNSSELPVAVANSDVDFTITNPALYVALEYRHGASRIATLKYKRSNKGYTVFGGVIFRRADRTDIADLDDLKGKKFMAVAENSFGGWIVAWRHLTEHQINPHKDFQNLLFGGSHDSVVFAVRDGLVDAGTVRTDTLERLALLGKINMSDYRILSGANGVDYQDFPFLKSTTLYPEWPFAKMRQTDETQAKQFGLALLSMTAENQAAQDSQSIGWTSPSDYYAVHECLKILQQAPYGSVDDINLPQYHKQYQIWILLIGGLVVYIFWLNRRFHSTMEQLECQHKQREQVVTDLNEFKITLDNINDCVFMFVPDTLKYLYGNEGAQIKVGYTQEELKELTPVDLMPEFSEEQFRTKIAPLLDEPMLSTTFSTHHQPKIGPPIPVEIFLQFVKEKGRQGRFVAIVRDISQRLQEQLEKEQLLAKLLNEQKMASVGQMAAGIAHEINTPIQYIGNNIAFLNEAHADIFTLIATYEDILKIAKARGFLTEEIIHADKALAESDWDYLKEEIPLAIAQSSTGVEQVSTIVLAMKEFAHPGTKDKQKVDLNKLIETTTILSRNEWKYAAELELKLDPSLPMVSCQGNEISQVLLNVIINGAHAIVDKNGGGADGEKGLISIATGQHDQQVEIKVKDSGIGIPEELVHRIFDPFFTTKEVGKGTGQGLAIAHNIITNKHCGTLEVETSQHEGTTVFIRIPR